VKFDRAVEIHIYNDTKSPHKIYGDAVVLTSGVYEVYYGGLLAARLRLMSHTPNTAIINLPAANTTPAPTATAAAGTQTAATAVVDEKPHACPTAYAAVVVAVATAVLIIYAACSRPTARR
jgi:hypothetical protein